MTRQVGVATIVRTVAPQLRLVRPTVSLTKVARLRLKWMEFYRTHGSNAALTCRHFGIARSCFYKWRQRFQTRGPKGLEDSSRRPKQLRRPTTPTPVVDTVRKLRRSNPELSKYKLAVILKRDYGYAVSPSTVGRILQRYDLFFRPRLSKRTVRYNRVRLRKPKLLVACRPGDVVEVDVKHLPHNGSRRRYGFVAIDVASRQATVHVASTISSKQAAIAWQKTVARLGLPQAVVTDNGSENLGAFADLLHSQAVTHYFARPYQPKDKPYVERFIGSLERECIQWGGCVLDTADQQALIDAWLDKYHTYRPHQALGYLTPNEYFAKLQT
jgi:transposase InsO family protein